MKMEGLGSDLGPVTCWLWNKASYSILLNLRLLIRKLGPYPKMPLHQVIVRLNGTAYTEHLDWRSVGVQ